MLNDDPIKDEVELGVEGEVCVPEGAKIPIGDPDGVNVEIARGPDVESLAHGKVVLVCFTVREEAKRRYPSELRVAKRSTRLLRQPTCRR